MRIKIVNNLSSEKINKEDCFIWFNQGKLLTKLGQLEAALDCLDRAIAAKENFYEAWSEKGYILEKLNRFEEADVCFNHSLGAFCGSIDWEEQDECCLMIY